MRIKFLFDVPAKQGGYKKDSVIAVEDSKGQAWIDAGYARKASEGGVEENLKTIVEAAVGAAIESKGYGGHRSHAAPIHPARVRITPGEQQEDRTKGFADQVKLITVAMCPNTFPGKQGEARELLENKYGSQYREFEKKDLAEGSGVTGGYTVKPDYGTELLRLADEESIVRPYSNNKQLPAREAYYPMLNQTFVPGGGASAYYGGVNMTWLGEAQPGTLTEPNFKQVHIKTNELQGLTKLSRFLVNDSFLAIEAELKAIFSGAIAYAEDMAFLNGDGNAKPKGILQSPALLTVARATSSQFKLADAAKMMGSMLPQSRPKAVWVLTNTLFEYLVQLADSSGRVTYLPNVGTGYNDAKLAMGSLLLFGRPVVFTERLPALGSTGDVLLADFSKYITADTGTLEIAASDQYAFNTNQITYRVIARVDGAPQIDAPVTQQDGTTKISPFVALHS
ncbi:phage major capsid protein [Singulisphaera sp. PoT]|uniref:phage major capsid protein n=1 Tax=Singulisphaera sp. PoT TaxID=3411797 RepID=UPI003BF57E26